MRPKPMLKWVGGKGQLLPTLSKLITHKSRVYFEPFVGGGAVFFRFAERKRFQRAVLNDTNAELINCYEVVRDQPANLIKRLDTYKADPCWNTQEYFLQVRASEPAEPLERAARMIYLNRTCFNGLYRVNRAGKFNTPFGRYANPTLYDKDTLRACSEALNEFATLRLGDYATAVADAKAGDIVYFDPPYVPISATSNFTSYAGQFGPDEQRALAQLFRELVERGVFVVESNSDAPLVRELYEGFDLHVVGAKRNVNSKGDRRGTVNELVIVGQPHTLEINVPAVSYLPDVYPLQCADCAAIYSSANIVCPRCNSTRT